MAPRHSCRSSAPNCPFRTVSVPVQFPTLGGEDATRHPPLSSPRTVGSARCPLSKECDNSSTPVRFGHGLSNRRLRARARIDGSGQRDFCPSRADGRRAAVESHRRSALDPARRVDRRRSRSSLADARPDRHHPGARKSIGTCCERLAVGATRSSVDSALRRGYTQDAGSRPSAPAFSRIPPRIRPRPSRALRDHGHAASARRRDRSRRRPGAERRLSVCAHGAVFGEAIGDRLGASRPIAAERHRSTRTSLCCNPPARAPRAPQSIEPAPHDSACHDPRLGTERRARELGRRRARQRIPLAAPFSARRPVRIRRGASLRWPDGRSRDRDEKHRTPPAGGPRERGQGRAAPRPLSGPAGGRAVSHRAQPVGCRPRGARPAGALRLPARRRDRHVRRPLPPHRGGRRRRRGRWRPTRSGR